MKIISTEKDLVENYKFLKESAYKSKVSNAYDGLIQNAPITLEEGLITTYPATRVVAAIKDHFKLSLTQEEICFAKIIFNQKLESNGEISLSTGNNGEEVIVITLSNDNISRDVYNAMAKYGWYLGRIDETPEGNKSYTYEKKFGTRITAASLLNYTDRLYHVTSRRKLDSILKKGLVPRGGSLTNDFKDKDTKESETKTYFYVNKPTQDNVIGIAMYNDPIVLSILLKRLNPSHTFYFDPQVTNAVFSYEPIPPGAINSELNAPEV